MRNWLKRFAAVGIVLACSCVARGDLAATIARADGICRGEMCEVSVPWNFPSNRIDWLFDASAVKGPVNPEWVWQLNRMSFWKELADAYQATHDEKYARAFARQLEDWLDQTGGKPKDRANNGRGSPWRTIEEGLRLMGSWHIAGEAFAASPSFTPELKARFVASARAQAENLMRHPSVRGNWLLMEMNGAYTFACDHPEFPESKSTRQLAAKRLSDAIREQVLPDGMQYELSPDYHSVAIGCAAQMYGRALASGFANELPADFAPLLERMGSAVVALTTPALVQPRFNDCFTMHAPTMLARLARFFPARRDFEWVVTERAKGQAPQGKTASRFLPYAGFAAMRTGWGADDAYLCFDMGPLGMAHQHQDKLSFTYWKGDEELIFEDGGGQYEDSAFRSYGLSGYDHNVLLVDGLAQRRKEPKISKEPIDALWRTDAREDFVRGTYDQGFGNAQKQLARHVREITFTKPDGVAHLVDRVTSRDGQPHTYTLLFQLNTTNAVEIAEGRHLVAHYGAGKKWALSLTFGGDAQPEVTTACARLKPRLAGWYVGRNDETLHPATTVLVTVKNRPDVILETTIAAIPATADKRDFNTSK